MGFFLINVSSIVQNLTRLMARERELEKKNELLEGGKASDLISTMSLFTVVNSLFVEILNSETSRRSSWTFKPSFLIDSKTSDRTNFNIFRVAGKLSAFVFGYFNLDLKLERDILTPVSKGTLTKERRGDYGHNTVNLKIFKNFLKLQWLFKDDNFLAVKQEVQHWFWTAAVAQNSSDGRLATKFPKPLFTGAIG